MVVAPLCAEDSLPLESARVPGSDVADGFAIPTRGRHDGESARACRASYLYSASAPT